MVFFIKTGKPKIFQNFYEALGISQKANAKEIRKNYLKIARKYHPDKNPETLVKFNLLRGIFFTYMSR